MVDEKNIISQCVDLANQVIKNGLNATIVVEIGENFKFKFDNKEETLNGKQFKKKSPSKEARNIERCKKFKESLKDNKIIEAENVEPVPPLKEETIESDPQMKVKADEIELAFDDICEKIFVIPKYDKEKANAAIEHEINEKFKEIDIKVRKIFVQRDGHPIFGKYNRSIILIEPFAREIIKKHNFGIENCWVLMDR